jgi:hypothetical protein
MDRQTLAVNKLTSLQQDENLKKYETIQAMGSGNYVLKDYTNIFNKSEEIATSQPYVNFSDGHGISKDIIDKEKKVGKINNFRGDANQLYPRPYLTIPYTGKGNYDVDKHSEIRSYNISADDRACNSLSGVSIEQQYTPLVPNLKDNIQNPINIIQEDSVPDWYRGGIDTTQIRKDIDFFERCLDDEKVREILTNKKAYLTNKPVVRTNN